MSFAERPIIVTGCARSGTSLVAGVLHYCGAWTGKVTGPTNWNRKGQFENEDIRDKLTKPYLKEIGVDPMGQGPLPPVELIWPSKVQGYRWKEQVDEILEKQGYPKDRPWMFKGAKACLIWTLWATAFPKAQWVIVRRDTERIVDSCLKTSFMRRYKDRNGWRQWVEHHKEKFRQIYSTCPGTQVIWPDSVISKKEFWRFQTLVENLGLDWNEDKVREFVDPSLWSG